MRAETLWKKLKRRLKMRRQWLHFASFLVLPAALAAASAVISPAAAEKVDVYFGVDRDGQLVLFDGPPREERTIRTFFQLDIERMESSLPRSYVEQLKKGIRVADADEFNSVLSTLADFAKEPAERP